ncbi:ras and Rab interactor-like protein isoform X2 [Rhineura floridana]|uniref:ras and Rab interactor-like protein isoform X2 n=1 Tax=Rhineura floridana TaxID=261503 RepID=UPI002AC8063A|nr:ras and Rab interactor-like protein isoform X2 [Rhineura floridana]
MQTLTTFIIARHAAGGFRELFLQTQESGSDAVCCFPMKEESSAVYFEGSLLHFRDLLELVSFHLVSRDILPCLLRIPDAIRLPKKPELDAVAALGMKFWTMPFKPGNGLTLPEVEEGSVGLDGDPPESRQMACSIRVTSEDRALCIINPLFLSMHSDAGWLDLASSLCRSSTRRETLRLSNDLGSLQKSGSTEAACRKQGAQECLDRQDSLEEEEEEEMEKAPPGDAVPCSATERQKLLPDSLAWSSSETASEEVPLSPDPLQKEMKSPHRVSWIEGMAATSPPCWPLQKSSSEPSLVSETVSLPPIPELDSLSVSSVEDEGNGLPLATAAPPKKHRRSSSILTYKVFQRLSAVGSTLSGFLSAEHRVSKRVQELAQDPASYVGGLVQSFVGHILRGAGTRHPTSTDMLQEIRQMISNLKGYLCESSELRMVCEQSEAEEVDLGSVVEAVLYKCMLKPLRDSTYAQLLDFHTRDGTLEKLREHQATMRRQSLAELGVTARVPDGSGLERIQSKLSLMHQAYSPKKKATQMLQVCTMLYEAMNQTAGRTEPFGADDFLPVLIYMLVKSDVVSVQLDVEYMMELMDPSQLQGEGGYYLTTWFGALYHIENFQPAAMVSRQISIEAQRSIHQWHRRRTIHPHQANRRHSQNILYVSFCEPFSNQKAISIPADMTTASMCTVCAEKYAISDPGAYGLFLVSGDSSQLLAEDSCPQRLRLDILQSKGGPVSFVYKPKDGVLLIPPSLQNPNSLAEAQESLESLDAGPLEAD